MKLIIRVKGVSSAGPEWSIAHVLKAEIVRPGGNEFGVQERLASRFGNLIMPDLRGNKRSISEQLEAAAHRSTAKEKVKAVIFSFEDTLDPAVREKQVEMLNSVVTQFQKQFAPGARYWCGVHVDRNHVHAHLFLANWSPDRNTSLNWSKRDLVYMLSLRWHQPDLDSQIEPGAWSCRTPASKVYTRTAAALELVGRIKDNPAAGVLTLEKYKTKANSPGVKFNGKKLTVISINHELRKIGCTVGLDEDYNNMELGDWQRGQVEQQQRIDEALGVRRMTLHDYDRFCDLPDPFVLCQTDEEKQAVVQFMETGKILDRRMAAVLSRLVRTAIQRRILGASEPLKWEPRWVYEQAGWTAIMAKAMNGIVNIMLAVIPPGLLQTELALWQTSLQGIIEELDIR